MKKSKGMPKPPTSERVDNLCVEIKGVLYGLKQLGRQMTATCDDGHTYGAYLQQLHAAVDAIRDLNDGKEPQNNA